MAHTTEDASVNINVPTRIRHMVTVMFEREKDQTIGEDLLSLVVPKNKSLIYR